MGTQEKRISKTEQATELLDNLQKMADGPFPLEASSEADQNAAGDPDSLKIAEVESLALLPPTPAVALPETETEAAAKEAAFDAARLPEEAKDGAGDAPPAPPDKPSLTARIKNALAVVDRVDRQKLCKELGVPIPEFEAAVTALVEAKRIKEDAISDPPVLYLPLSDKERKQHKEDVAKAKGHDRFMAIERIHDNRTYREDYASWEDFLHYELGYENPHDWWAKEKRRVRIQQRMDERGIKMEIPLTKYMADHLNKVRDDADVFVACVTEFQNLPKKRQIAKSLGEIVERHRDHKSKLSALRQFVADATEQEIQALTPVYAADHKWRRWYPEHTKELQARVQSGRPIRDCLLDMAQEIKSLPRDTVLLNVARGADLVPLVNDLMRMVVQWDQQKKREDEIAEWERQGQRLHIYDPSSGTVTKTTDGKPIAFADTPPPASPDPKGPDGNDGGDAGSDGEPGTTFYSVQLSGDFPILLATEGCEAISQDDLVELLNDLADALSEGSHVSCPSSITISPVSVAEQSA